MTFQFLLIFHDFPQKFIFPGFSIIFHDCRNTGISRIVFIKVSLKKSDATYTGTQIHEVHQMHYIFFRDIFPLSLSTLQPFTQSR